MRVLIPEDEIRKRVDELAAEVARAYAGQPLTIVGVLTGCLVFLADLIRRLDLPLKIALVQASSYRGRPTTAGDLHVQDELLPDLKGRHILLIDDILDTGKTLKHLVGHLKGLGVASVRTAVLLAQGGPAGGAHRAGLRRVHHPQRVRRRLRAGLRRRVPQPAVHRRAGRPGLTPMPHVQFLVPDLGYTAAARQVSLIAPALATRTGRPRSTR